MTTVYRNLTTICLATVLAFGLAACGGGSNTQTGGMPTTADQLAELQKEVADLRTQLGLPADGNISDSITELQGQVADLKQQIQDAKDAEDKAAMAVAVATARKLYAGIAAQDSTAGDVAANTAAGDGLRAAAYNNADVPEAGTTAETRIMVGIGTAAVVALSEDDETMVAANHGWAGKRYARTSPAADGTYEAVVYSNVEAPKQGRKFGSAAAVSDTGAYEYQLDAADRDGNANKALTIVPATHAARVSLPSVTRTAGTETFKLPEQNPDGEQYINVSGMLHGVSGTFSCAPTTAADECTAAVAAKGFTLGGAGTWLFIPSNAEARVMDAADTAYASYGWWLHKTENDLTYTASAFHDEKGGVTNASGLNALNGTATYVGGAAGKYALSSATGGTNDAGHFTARATLEADFTNNTDATAISGTIDNFMGADGQARDWEVELKGSQIGDDGEIGEASASTDVETVWTIGGTDGAADGMWTGRLRNNGDDLVPQVATGTFYSTYGTAGGEGRMVGGFGANKE